MFELFYQWGTKDYTFLLNLQNYYLCPQLLISGASSPWVHLRTTCLNYEFSKEHKVNKFNLGSINGWFGGKCFAYPIELFVREPKY